MRRVKLDVLAQVSGQLQTVLIVTTVGITVLPQWRFQAESTPLFTAGALALCMVSMIRIAVREESPI